MCVRVVWRNGEVGSALLPAYCALRCSSIVQVDRSRHIRDDEIFFRVRLDAMTPILMAFVVVALILVLSLVSLRRIRWPRKPHLGHLERIAGIVSARSMGKGAG